MRLRSGKLIEYKDFKSKSKNDKKVNSLCNLFDKIKIIDEENELNSLFSKFKISKNKLKKKPKNKYLC